VAAVGIAIPAMSASAATPDPSANPSTTATAAPSPSPSPTATSSTAPTLPYGASHICMYENDNSCLLGQGGGNQVETSTSSASNWYLVNNTIGTDWYQIQDGNGNCLREGTNNVVKLENSSCNANDQTDWWYIYGNNPPIENLRNSYYSGDYMGVYGTNGGRPVWAHPKASGFYTGWEFQS
jgi:hypothetical protein